MACSRFILASISSLCFMFHGCKVTTFSRHSCDFRGFFSAAGRSVERKRRAACRAPWRAGVALLGFVGSCYGHGDVGLLPHHAVTLPLPADQSVPSDGIVPSKNLCHWFKERILRVSRGVQTPSGGRSFRRLNGEHQLGIAHAHTHKIAAERYAGGIAGPGLCCRAARPAGA